LSPGGESLDPGGDVSKDLGGDKGHVFNALENQSISEKALEEAIEYLTDPISGSKAKGKVIEGIVTIHVDDCYITGGTAFAKVVDKLRKDFEVGHEDHNDAMFVGQRIHWREKGKPNGHIEVDQNVKIEELTEVNFDNSKGDKISCTPDQHHQYRSVLGMINWLQSRTQFQACYQFSRNASAAAGPTLGDCRAINKLVRTIRAGHEGENIKLCFWPVKGTPRLVGYPDAAFQNNADKSSQRAQCVFIVSERKTGVINPVGSLVDYVSKKIKKACPSTTVAELHAFHKCFGTCMMLRGLWMDMTAQTLDIHMRTDANNLVTTARTTHLPEQEETIHMIQMMRHESCSGDIQDLAHVVTKDMLADCLTKSSASPDALIKAVNTGYLPGTDTHPPFRQLMKNKHKAFLVSWIVNNLKHASLIHSFMGEDVIQDIRTYYGHSSTPPLR
jgi:hypothetical protein